jgi:hypothetical protein
VRFHSKKDKRFLSFLSETLKISSDAVPDPSTEYYVLLITDLYACRGLPILLYDHELMRQAERAVGLSDAKKPQKTINLGGSPGMEGYSGYSSNGSSVSTTPLSRIDEMSDKIMAQLVNLTRRARQRSPRSWRARRK